jgi:hypothetical protein
MICGDYTTHSPRSDPLYPVHFSTGGLVFDKMRSTICASRVQVEHLANDLP